MRAGRYQVGKATLYMDRVRGPLTREIPRGVHGMQRRIVLCARRGSFSRGGGAIRLAAAGRVGRSEAEGENEEGDCSPDQDDHEQE
jgi:hypothetical protein